jgi:hypothetical protein
LLEVVQPKVCVRTRIALLALLAGPRLGAVESLIARHRNFQGQTKNNLAFSLRNLRQVTCSRDSGDFVFLLAA